MEWRNVTKSPAISHSTDSTDDEYTPKNRQMPHNIIECLVPPFALVRLDRGKLKVWQDACPGAAGRSRDFSGGSPRPQIVYHLFCQSDSEYTDRGYTNDIRKLHQHDFDGFEYYIVPELGA